MEFLGIGYQELILVLVLMLVVVGPERLPAVAYQIGKAVRTMQKYARAVRDEFGGELGYLEEQYKTLKGEVDSAQAQLRAEQQKLNRELKETSQQLSESTKVDLPPLLAEAETKPVESATNGQTPAASTNGTAPVVSANGTEQEPGTGAGKPPLVF